MKPRRRQRGKRARKAAAHLPAPPAPAAPESYSYADALEEGLAYDEAQRAEVCENHTWGLSASVYSAMIEKLATIGSDLLTGDVHDYIADFMARCAPRDPFEEQLAAQMLVTHVRILHANVGAIQCQQIKWAAMYNEAADRAANTYRRMMLALKEYRAPPRPKFFAAIRQMNNAQQQVVQNEILKNENLSNEQGSSGLDKTRQAPALPANTGGARFPPRRRRANPPLEVQYGPADGSGQDAFEDERPPP